MENPQRKKPALNIAIRFITAFIDSQSLKPSTPLPSVRTLAKLADVSYVTMCKAIAELRSAGVLEKGPGGYYQTGRSPKLSSGTGGDVQPAERKIFLRPTQRIVEAIIDDIRNGVFRCGMLLPPIKDLQRRYRVSDKTISKALRCLEAEEIVERIANGKIAVPRLSSGTWKPTVSCILMAANQYEINFGQNDGDVFRTLESLCENSGIRMDNIFTFLSAENAYFFRRLRTGEICERSKLELIASDSTIQGFIYFMTWPFNEGDAMSIGYLVRSKKPVAILDETASFMWSAMNAKPRNVRLFTVGASSQPAVMVARHLLALNHCRVAFFSADHHYAWSKLREEGLRSSYERAGYVNGVVSFVVETPSAYDDSIHRGDLGALAALQRPWHEALPEPYRIEFDKVMEKIRWESWPHAELRLQLLPMFEAALQDPGITAWVAVNDLTASMALDFLRQRNIRVPDDISLISFDDSSRALAQNLSSYNFNVYAIATSMLGFILGKKPYDRTMATKGYIIDRGSTGPAKK